MILGTMASKEDKRKLARTQGRFTASSISHRKILGSRNGGVMGNNTVSNSTSKEISSVKIEQNCPNSDDRLPNTGHSSSISCNDIKLSYLPNAGSQQCVGFSPLKELSSSFQPGGGKINHVLHDRLPKKATEISEYGWHVLEGGSSGISRIFYDEHFFCKEEADGYFADLLYGDAVKWDEKKVKIGDTFYVQPRMVSWFGPIPYSYSGTTLEENNEPPPVVQIIQKKVEDELQRIGLTVTFNSVLLNLYRHCKDSVAWHSDNELLMGVHPIIASVSLGEVRRFEIRKFIPKSNTYTMVSKQSYDQEEADYKIFLPHGSLMVMAGAMQQDWQHRVPKEFHDKAPRINLTFRRVYPVCE